VYAGVEPHIINILNNTVNTMDFHQEHLRRLLGVSIEDTENVITNITNDITDNTAAIQTNATNIGTNATNIGLNTTAIGTNATNIGLNTTAIGNIINDSSTSLTSTWSSQEIDNQLGTLQSQISGIETLAQGEADIALFSLADTLTPVALTNYTGTAQFQLIGNTIQPQTDGTVLYNITGVASDSSLITFRVILTRGAFTNVFESGTCGCFSSRNFIFSVQTGDSIDLQMKQSLNSTHLLVWKCNDGAPGTETPLNVSSEPAGTPWPFTAEGYSLYELGKIGNGLHFSIPARVHGVDVSPLLAPGQPWVFSFWFKVTTWTSIPPDDYCYMFCINAAVPPGESVGLSVAHAQEGIRTDRNGINNDFAWPAGFDINTKDNVWIFVGIHANGSGTYTINVDDKTTAILATGLHVNPRGFTTASRRPVAEDTFGRRPMGKFTDTFIDIIRYADIASHPTISTSTLLDHYNAGLGTENTGGSQTFSGKVTSTLF
jgi:hypothetical protein